MKNVIGESRLRSAGRVTTICITAAICLGSNIVGTADAAPVRRWALLVGVDDYAVLKDLEFAGADQRALAQQLGRAGFPADQIVLLEDSGKAHKYHPNRANIQRELKLFLKLVNPGDVVLIGFSGHGVSLAGKSYLCPAEASLDDPAGTMLPLDDIYAELQACPATFKLLLVDACRNDPRQDGERSATPTRSVSEFARSLEHPPEGLLILSSCGRDQVAWEEKEFGHGVFMHFVLEGLRGKAADEEGSVRLARLYDYASDQTKKYVARKFSAYQSPAFEGRVDGPFELARLDVRPLPTTPPPSSPIPAPPPSSSPVPTPPSKPVSTPPSSTPPATAGKVITNSIGMKLALIPAGEFLMGSPETELEDDIRHGDDNKEHRVRITKPFYLGVYEVTLDEFLRFYGAANYKSRWKSQGDERGVGLETKNGKSTFYTGSQYVPWSWGHPDQTPRHPAVNVSWNDAVAFCEWLSRKEKMRYRLPTEAEWEYACRAGTTTRFCNGDDDDGLLAIGNVRDASFRDAFDQGSWGIKGRDGFPFTAPVGRFQPNGFGLYDMHGNAWEWCSDWYSKEYYNNSPVDDPRGPSTGSSRALRGGGWDCFPVNGRSADRVHKEPANRRCSDGFRVVRVVE